MRRRGLIFNSGSSGSSGGSSNWWENYMTIEALEDELTVSLAGLPAGMNLEYSLNGKTWTTLEEDTYSPEINMGDIIAFRGNGSSYASSNRGVGTFSISCKFNLLGNCMSLLYGDNAIEYDTVPNYAFYNLFDSSYVVSVSDCFLPAISVGKHSYDGMFLSCKNLIKAPLLPATTLDSYCYYYMFSACTNLTDIPDVLPATSLAGYCYDSMFRSCSSIVRAPILPALSLALNSYDYMFMYCTKLNYITARFLTNKDYYTDRWVFSVSSTGTFIKHANATWDVTGSSGIPSGWTVEYDTTIDGISDATFTLDSKTWHFKEGDTWNDLINRCFTIFSYENSSSELVIYSNGGVNYYVKNSNYANIPKGNIVKSNENYRLEKITAAPTSI